MGIGPKATGFQWSHYRGGCAVPGLGYLEFDVDIPSGGYRWAVRAPKSDRVLDQGLAATESEAKAAAEQAAKDLGEKLLPGGGHVYSA